MWAGLCYLFLTNKVKHMVCDFGVQIIVCGLMLVLFHPLTWSFHSRAGWGDGGRGGQLPWRGDSQAACGKFHRVRNQGLQPAAMWVCHLGSSSSQTLTVCSPTQHPYCCLTGDPKPAHQLSNSQTPDQQKLWDSLFIVLSYCIFGWCYAAVDNGNNWDYSHCKTDSGPK